MTQQDTQDLMKFVGSVVAALIGLAYCGLATGFGFTTVAFIGSLAFAVVFMSAETALERVRAR